MMLHNNEAVIKKIIFPYHQNPMGRFMHWQKQYVLLEDVYILKKIIT